jgi:hypothetical protein
MLKQDFIAVTVAAVLATLLALAPIGYLAYQNRPRHIATVDLQRLVEEEQKRAMDVISHGGGVSEEQRDVVQKLTVDFAKKLSATIDMIGVDCRCVIVNKAALLGGSAVDYTDAVRERIKR